MNHVRYGGVFSALLLAAGCALAGPSSLIWIPSTDLQPARTGLLGIDGYDAGSDGHSTYLYGVYGCEDRWEVGVDYLEEAENPWYLHAKVLLRPEDERGPAVALGGYGFGLRRDSTDDNLLYLVGARTFAWGRLTAGYAHGKRSTLGANPDMLLLGFDRYLDEAERLWAAADYQSGHNAYGAFSLGLSYALSERIILNTGYSWLNDAAAADALYLGLSLTMP